MGQATAVAFVEAGASILVADVDESGAQETLRLVDEAGGTAEFVKTDVGVASQVEHMVDAAVKRFGGVDAAVNCAAIFLENSELVDCEESTFDELIRVNLKSIFLCLKYEVRAMRAQGRGGAIVNIGSISSYRPQYGEAVYTATKHGVIGLSKTAAIECAADGIRVNVICPGAIDTPMLRNSLKGDVQLAAVAAERLSLIGRFGTSAEIAHAARWLCSDEASYVIGASLPVDAGYLAR
jgi:glucose 1-dehydrogenase